MFKLERMILMPVCKNEKRNSWYVSFYYTDWTGTRKKKKKEGFATKKEAIEYERSFMEKTAGKCTMKFKSLVEIYLEDCQKRIKNTTYALKKSIIKKYINPFFSNIALNEITPEHIRQWQSRIMEDNSQKSGQYLHNINIQLSCIFNFAKKYYGIDKNPVQVCDMMGNMKNKKMSFWTLAEFKLFLAEMNKKDSLYLAYNLLFWTGIRRGELLALRPKNFDFAEKTLSITHNVVFVNSRPQLTTPKTESSKRTINMPVFLMNMVKKYIYEHKISSDEFLFNFLPSYLMENIKFYSKKAKIKPIKIHDFRHSHVSLLIEQGFSPLIIAQRLGHKDVTMTLRIYAHLYPNKQQKLADELHNLYKNNIDKNKF